MSRVSLSIVAAGFAAAVTAAGAAMTSTGVVGSAGADTWETTPPTTPYAPGSAPSDKADVVVKNLQSAGYRVILNKVGAAPLDNCTVTSVNPGTQITQLVTAGARGMQNQVLYTTVYVTADCTSHGQPTSSP
ncbi:MAG: hypothetical protein JO280_14095 [Mycobacteriaceae bacterium]|nr:hypothetical protein [Mycobacteriaceae bacterium]